MEDIEQLQSMLNITHFEPQQPLFVEGNPATHFFILIEGEVEISCVSKDGVDEFIMLKRAGDSVGDVALLDDQARYTYV
jgi:CRP-like cAMP-binding protein